LAEDESETAWPDISGHIHEGRHVLPVRVYFEDTDFSGFVYHASYFRWCERGRSDFLRLAGIEHAALAGGVHNGEPCAFAVRRIGADFLKPGRIDDILEVQTVARASTKASITLSQTIIRGAAPIFTLEAQCVLVSFSGKLLRIPNELLARIPQLSS